MEMTDLTDFEIPTWRMLWQRFWQTPSPSPTFVPRKRNPPPIVQTTPPRAQPRGASWATVQYRVRQWPPGMPVTVDVLVATFGVGRGTAWHWLQRLTQAGLLAVTYDPPNARGTRRRRWWVSAR